MHMSGMSMASTVFNTNVGFMTLGKCKGHIARDIKFTLKCRIKILRNWFKYGIITLINIFMLFYKFIEIKERLILSRLILSGIRRMCGVIL